MRARCFEDEFDFLLGGATAEEEYHATPTQKKELAWF